MGIAHTVEIYVIEHCPICRCADEVAAIIREEFPAVAVHFIDVAQPGAVVPECVFATPTYLLDGRRWSLGNPSLDLVRKTLSASEN